MFLQEDFERFIQWLNGKLGDTELVSATVPVNPWTGATVIVDVPAVPAVVVTDVGLAVTVKSFTVTVTVAV